MSLVELLQKIHDQRSLGFDREKELAAWRHDVDGLLAQLETWLRPAAEKGIATTGRNKILLQEEDLGDYEIDALTIIVGDETIHVHPVARFAMGSDGIVFMDRVGRPDRGSIFERLLEDSGVIWKIKGRSLAIASLPTMLTEENFSAAVQRLFAE